jgi:hypothetical protein
MFGLAVANAQPAPLPSSFESGATLATITNNSSAGFLGGQGIDGGGAFEFAVTAGTGPTYNTAFWCVDDQLYFTWGESGQAEIVPLDEISSVVDPSNPLVRYSNVTNSGPGPTWTNTGGGLPSAAFDRYVMAAYLVTQYGGFSGTNEANVISGDYNQNEAIQEAIWAITDNTAAPNEGAPSFSTIEPANLSNPTYSNSYWIAQAESILSNTTLVDSLASHFAVVSWQLASNGDPSTVADYNSGANQTFLAYDLGGGTSVLTTTPEPGFYGVLAAGLGGLLLAVSRRKKNAQRC